MQQDENDDLGEIKCDFSGVVATAEEVALIDPADDIGLPPGWLAVTVTRRVPNPAYATLQTAKAVRQAGLEAQLPSDMPEADRSTMLRVFAVDVEAHYKALDGDPAYAPTLEESEVKIIAPPHRVEGGALDGVVDALINTFGFQRRLVQPKKRKRAPGAGAAQG